MAEESVGEVANREIRLLINELGDKSNVVSGNKDEEVKLHGLFAEMEEQRRAVHVWLLVLQGRRMGENAGTFLRDDLRMRATKAEK